MGDALYFTGEERQVEGFYGREGLESGLNSPQTRNSTDFDSAGSGIKPQEAAGKAITLHRSFQRAHLRRIQLRWLRWQTPSG